MDETVTITKQHYEELKEAQTWVECLEACGVDNWSGYEDAQEMFKQGLP